MRLCVRATQPPGAVPPSFSGKFYQKLFLLVPQPGPDGYTYEDERHNDPDNKIGCREWTCFRHYLYESDNTRDDNDNGQRKRDS